MKNRRNFVKMGIVHFMAFPETMKGEGPILEAITKIVKDDSIEAIEIAEELKKDFPNFGIMYDLSHAPLLREHPADALIILKEHLVHIHIGNCVVSDKNHPAYGDQHPPFGIEGGANNTAELSNSLATL